MGARSAPNVVTIAGINVETPVSVTGAGSPQIRINGGSWGTSGVITKNQTLEVRLTSATTDSTTRSADVTFRTVMESWNVRTIDTTPDTFSFTDVTLAAFNALTTSNTITISGIDTPTSVSVGGDGSPQVSINGGAWVTSGTIASGQSLAVHLTSASAGSTARSATVTVGGVSDNWSVTTKSTVVPGSQTFTSSGTFVVPAYNTLTVKLWGSGGAGGAYDGCTVSPTAGTATSFQGLLAAGGRSGGFSVIRAAVWAARLQVAM